MRPQVPEGLTVKYFHYREIDGLTGPISPKGGSTVALLFDRDGDLVARGVATCHQKDNFNKRIARDISLGRAVKTYQARKKVT